MAKITRLSDVATDNFKPRGLKSAFKECLCIPACVALAAALPLAIVGFGIIYLSSRLVFSLTGKYPLNLSLHLGNSAD